METDKVSKPILLNEFFKIESYNGGSQANKEEQYGVNNIFDLKPRKCHCTNVGKNFDLVLRFEHKESKDFTITHMVIMGGVACTSPIKEGLLWVHPSKPNLEEYSAKYNDFTQEQFNQLQRTGSPNEPELFFVTNNNIDQDIYEYEGKFKKGFSGSYLHLKWLRPTKGNNYDIEFVALFGFPTKNAPLKKIGPVPKEFKLNLKSQNVVDTRIQNSADERMFKIPEASAKVIRLSAQIVNIGFHATEPILAFSSPSKVISLWNWKLNEPFGQFEELYEGLSNAIRFDGDRVWATSSTDARILIWDYKTKKLLHAISTINSALCLEPHNGMMWTSTSGGTVLAYDLNTFELKHKITERGGLKTLIVIGDKVWVGGDEKKLKIFDIKSGKLEKELTGHTGTINSIVYVQGKVFSAGEDKKIKVWDPENYSLIADLEGHVGTVTKLVVFDETTIYSCSADKSIRIWDAKTLEWLNTLDGGVIAVRSMFALPSQKIVFSWGLEANLKLWEIERSECSSLILEHDNTVRCGVIFGNLYLSGSFDNTVKVYDRTSDQIIATLQHTDIVTDLAIGDELLFSSCLDKQVRMWDLKTFECIRTFKIPEGGRGVRFYKGYIIAGCNKDLRMWNAETGQLVWEVIGAHEDEIWCVELVGEKVFTASSDKTIKAWNVKKGNELMKLTGHTGTIYALAASPSDNHLYSGSADMSIKVWDTITGELKNTVYGQYGFVTTLSFENGKLFSGGADKALRIWDCKTWDCLAVLKGHTGAIFCVSVSDEILFTGSVDKTVRMWNLQLIMAPKVFFQCYTAKRLQEVLNSPKVDLKKEDCYGRSLVMLLCSFGLPSLAPLIKGNEMNGYIIKFQELIEKHGIKLVHQNENGEDGLFFAIKNQRWALLKALSAYPGIGPELTVQGTKLVHFLKTQAYTDEVNFFKGLLSSGISFKGRSEIDIMAHSFLRQNKLLVIKYWLSVTSDVNVFTRENRWSLLHYAAEFANPVATKLLLEDSRIKSNPLDIRGNLPIHLALARRQNPLTETRGVQRTEREVFLDRLDVAKVMLSYEESSKRPKLFVKNSEGLTAYALMLLRQDDFNEELKVAKKELSEQDTIAFTTNCFEKNLGLLDSASQRNDVRRVRNKFAVQYFMKVAVPYFIFLAGLLAVALGQHRNSDMAVYFGDSVRQTFLSTPSASGGTFYDIATISDFWDWMQGPLASGFDYQDWHPIGGTINDAGIFISGHRLIGGVQLKQIRQVNSSCEIPSKFPDGYIETCYSIDLKQDKDDYGMGDAFKYSEDPEGESFWGRASVNRMIFFPSGGFQATFAPNDTLAVSSLLQNNSWVDSSTRVIFVRFSIINVNLNLLAAVRFVLEFTPAGQILPYDDVVVVKPFRYLGASDYVILAIEIMLIIYFVVEFLVREFVEMFSLGRKYLADVWNYYEWSLIVLFITVVAIRIRSVIVFGGETLSPAITDFVNLHKYSDLVRSEREVMAALVIFCYLRALKFLVIPPATGPHTNSILQTMRARSFVVFIGFLIVVIFTFALAFHLAFGFNLVSLSNFGVSFVSVLRMIFGDIDYDGMVNTNRVLAPFFFIFFFLFLGLIMMNIFIAVISDIYLAIQKQNEAAWEIFITRLLIESVKSKGVMTSWDRIVSGLRWLRGSMRRKYQQKASQIALVELGDGIGLNNSQQNVNPLASDDEDDTANIGGSLTEEEISVVYDDKGIDKLMLKVAKRREEASQNELYEKVDRTLEEMRAMRDEFKGDIAQLKSLLQSAKK